MLLITRRQFLQETALASAALYACPKTLDVQRRVEQSATPLDPAEIRKLASDVIGQVITPDGPGYVAARSIFNRAFDRCPALIVRCASPSDVARALDFAQARSLPLAVRGGGHSRLGYGMCDGGVVIDLSAMKRVEVDVSKSVARAEAGALVRGLDEATQRFGLATTSGGCPTVGIAGLTLGGGEGRLMEKYGTACDNLLSAQVVTVDGRQVEEPAVQFRSFLGDSRRWRQFRRCDVARVSAPRGKQGCFRSTALSGGTHSRASAGFAMITTAINNAPTTCKLIIVPLRGAVSRVGLTDTAYALRQPGFEVDMAGVWNALADEAEVVRWVQATRDNLQPFAHGVYINQLGDTSDQLVRSGYGPNYARLVEIKKKYDPKNVLRLNQNIKPDSPSNG